MNFNFFFLIDIDIDNHLIFMRQVIFLQNLHIDIIETFLFEVFLYQQFCTVYQVGRNLISLYQSQLKLKIFPLRFLYSVIIDLRNTGTLFQADIQPRFIAIYLGNLNSYIRKQPLFPETLYSPGNIISRNFHRFPHSKPRKAYQDIIFIIFYPRYRYTGNLIFLGCSGIMYGRIIYRIGFRFCRCLRKCGLNDREEHSQQ